MIYIQNKWLSLDNIYSNQDIKKQLSNDCQIFDNSTKIFNTMMKKVDHKFSIREAIKGPAIMESITKLTGNFEGLQRSLEYYLDRKRQKFPRLYFLSNDEFINILAKSSTEIDLINQYLSKLFDSVNTLTILGEDKNWLIESINSIEGEKILLKRATLSARGY